MAELHQKSEVSYARKLSPALQRRLCARLPKLHAAGRDDHPAGDSWLIM